MIKPKNFRLLPKQKYLSQLEDRTNSLSFSVFLFALLLTFSGCSTILKQIVETPKIQNQKLDVKKISLESVELDLVVDLLNQNSFDVPLENLEFTILVDGKDLSSKKIDKLSTLAAKKTTQVKVPIELKWTRLWELGFNLLKAQEIPYEIQGTIKAKGFEIPFDEKNTLRINNSIK